MKLVPKRLLMGAAAVVLVAGACSGTAATTPPATVAPSVAATATPHAPVTVNWWHITTADPGKTIWASAAQQYMADHPWVTINITILENEAFKTKLQTTMQAGDLPDLFQSWGGGGMAQQADAGKLQDITTAVAAWTNPAPADISGMSIYAYKGKQYGVPWDMGMIGVFYNKDLFTQAGISGPPATWTDFMADTDKLKAAGIVPYSYAGKDEWPGMHLWTYLVEREGGADGLTQMVQSGNWNQDPCTKGGTDLAAFVAKSPFQPGFMSAVYDKGEAAAFGNGQAAMELQGQWGESVEQANSTSGKGVANLGWFTFPTIDGGKGLATDGVGGGNGIAVGAKAPAEAVDFLHFLMTTPINSEVGATGMGTPTNANALGSITDPIQVQILKARGAAKFIQLYLDQATSSAVGQAINDATASLMAGKSTPAQVCQAITDAMTKK